jgi:hypothetical protein
MRKNKVLLKGVAPNDRLLITFAPKFVYFEESHDGSGSTYKLERVKFEELLTGGKR